MKKPDSPRRPSLFSRYRALKNSLGIRSRVFSYFLLFTGLLVVLLWLFQIVFLEQFYQFQKTEMLKSSLDSLTRNIDNESLSALASRISEENNVCVLIVDESLQTLVSAEASPGCIVHHMSDRDLRRYTEKLDAGEARILRAFPMVGFKNNQYDAQKFAGRVPPSDDGSARSMVAAQRATLAQGGTVYVFLNAVITPVTATVQTIRNELFFITVILVLLSFLLSLFLSRRITRPLEETTAAARSLSRGEYVPVHSPVSYREIDQLNRQLTQAAHDLRRVEEMQRELIANISHDLRTPLTLIEGYAEVMRDLPGENTPENMQVIIDETKRLSTLVNAVLEYSASKNGKAEPEKKRFNLTASIREMMTRYQKLTGQEGYRIVFEPDADVFVTADELQVGQVIYNLINNALTYTGEDKTVTLTQTVRDGQVKIEVCDTGEGIAKEDLPYIWGRYYRGDKHHKRATVGTGLGLSIVRTILDRHGLLYGVESEKGKGSTFWFALPES